MMIDLKIQVFTQRLALIEQTLEDLKRLDPLTFEIVQDKYIYEKSWDEVSEKYMLSRSGLDAQIRNRLEKL